MLSTQATETRSHVMSCLVQEKSVLSHAPGMARGFKLVVDIIDILPAFCFPA